MAISTSPATRRELSVWQQWLQHPEKLRVHRLLFQIHLWVGMMAGLYLFVMSLSGSAIVFRNELENLANFNGRVFRAVEWLVDFHTNLLAGDVGRSANGMGAVCLTILCLSGAIVWWPGIEHWRRSLTLNWRSSLARTNWELHNALGFWCFLFVLMWGISGIYFSFPRPFNGVVGWFEPPSDSKLSLGDVVLTWLSNLHFGRFNIFTEAVWALLGLVPAVLVFTGIFMCCHRILIRKGDPLPR